VSETLVHVADRAAGWSAAADQIKSTQTMARWAVFGLSVAGALLAAMAGQIPTDQAGAHTPTHSCVAMLAAALLALGTFISGRFLGAAKASTWVRARAASEALKREAFKFAARAEPYDDLNGATRDERLNREREKIEEAAEKLAHPMEPPGRQGSSPRDTITHEQYRSMRVMAQAKNFYRANAEGYIETARILRRIEFGLAVGATIITVYAGAMGKIAVMHGGSFDLAALTAVLTTVSGAILAHIEALRLDTLVDTYRATARRLEDLDLEFAAASADPELWSRFVNKCEDIIAAENSSWVAKWSEDKA